MFDPRWCKTIHRWSLISRVVSPDLLMISRVWTCSDCGRTIEDASAAPDVATAKAAGLSVRRRIVAPEPILAEEQPI